MKVMELSEAWDVDHLRLVERPEPEPGPGEVKIRMQAASLNYRDTVMVRRGYGRRSGELPLVPVSDGAGEVVAVGDGVSRVAVGDLVCPAFAQAWISGPLKEDYWPHNLGGPRDGVMQEYLVLGEEGVARAPRGWTALEAATLPCAALTAWNAVVVCARTAPGEVVLVQGTGGVSLFALLFAKLIGAQVIATSSSADKLARARTLGADHVINYREDTDWGRTARELSGGRGADLVVEVGGAETLDASLRAVRTAGTIAMIGVLSGAEARLALGQVVTRGLRLTGVTIGNRDMLEALIRAIDRNGLTPPIDDHIYRFEELPEALRAFPQGAHFGKVCIRF